MESPLSKAIADFKEKYVKTSPFDKVNDGVLYCIQHLHNLLPYERQYLRDSAEKAIWYGVEIDDSVQSKHHKKFVQDYLNQNHPL